MPDKSALGERMKESYENRTKQFLTRRMPTIIRLDGKAFHSYTKGLDKPFDEGLIEDMQETTKFLCENIQGCRFGYTQSDEITLVLTDYDKLETSAWFDGNVQKITSISASLATAKFNQLRAMRKYNFSCANMVNFIEENSTDFKENRFCDIPLAFFDSRVFQIPEKEEVVNCLIWRQRDAEKNSIAMLAQSLYSHNELHKKNGSDMQEMCFQKGYNWNDLHFSKKRGSFIVRNIYINEKLLKDVDEAELGDIMYQPNIQSPFYPDKRGRLLTYALTQHNWNDWCDTKIETIRTKWEVLETPIFSQDRKSILKLI